MHLSEMRQKKAEARRRARLAMRGAAYERRLERVRSMRLKQVRHDSLPTGKGAPLTRAPRSLSPQG